MFGWTQKPGGQFETLLILLKRNLIHFTEIQVLFLADRCIAGEGSTSQHHLNWFFPVYVFVSSTVQQFSVSLLLSALLHRSNMEYICTRFWQGCPTSTGVRTHWKQRKHSIASFSFLAVVVHIRISSASQQYSQANSSSKPALKDSIKCKISAKDSLFLEPFRYLTPPLWDHSISIGKITLQWSF